MSILIVARHDDPHVSGLAAASERHGETVEHLELGHPPDGYDLSWKHTNEPQDTMNLTINGLSTDRIRKFRAVFCLPFAVNKPSQVSLRNQISEWDDSEIAFGEREWDATVSSALWLWQEAYQGPWITRLEASTMQDRKLALLHRASTEHGLLIPDFQVGSTFDVGDDFFQLPIVAKAINSYQEINPGTYFNTTEVKDELKPALAERSEVPNFLQRLVAPKAEYRVFVVFDRCFAVRIQRSREAQLPVDLRVVDQSHLSASLCELDHAVRLKLISLTESLQLRYCAFDLIEDDDAIYLLDINPVGGWYYIDNKYGLGAGEWIVSSILERSE
jgi:hypothetical protein